MAIDGSRIQRITAEGLFYLDENDQEQFIDFAACHELWFAKALQRLELDKSREQNPKMMKVRDMSIDHHIRNKTTYTYVADGSLLGFTSSGLPGLRFYTDPPTIFEFETRDDFDRVKSLIEDIGWKTAFFASSGHIQRISPDGLLYKNHDDEDIFIDFAAIQNAKNYIGERTFAPWGDGLVFYYLDFYTTPLVRFHEFWQSGAEIIEEIEQHGWKIDLKQ